MKTETVKTTIEIQRIKDSERFSKQDEVAMEYNLDIPLKNGEVVHVTCTPAHLEEMILARRYLAGDLTEEECAGAQEVLTEVSLEEIFSIPFPLYISMHSCAHSRLSQITDLDFQTNRELYGKFLPVKLL